MAVHFTRLSLLKALHNLLHCFNTVTALLEYNNNNILLYRIVVQIHIQNKVSLLGMHNSEGLPDTSSGSLN